MIKESFGLGDSIEEAKENALADLGADETADIQIEVIEIAKKKVFGMFGGTQAKVRAYIEVPDEKKPPSKVEKKSSLVNKTNKKASDSNQKTEKVSATTSFQKKSTDNDTDAEALANKAINYIKDVLKTLGCGEVIVSVEIMENGAKINLEGDDLGIIIGHRGETLDALQYLASLAANSKKASYFRIILNIGNYREKREKTLQGLAKRTASIVLRNGRSRSLEPMSPYERRIIHTTIQDIKGVSSHSMGEGAFRHVVISPIKSEKSSIGITEKKTECDSAPLYGKIN